MSKDDNTLRRAHQLSAKGNILTRSADVNLAALTEARDAYQEAADLYDVACNSADDATRPTLRMMTLQHRKLARDMARRIGSGTPPPSSPVSLQSPTSPSSPNQTSFPFASAGPSRTNTDPPSLGPRRTSATGVGLSAGSGGMFAKPGLVHATSPPRSVPPFSLRPVQESPYPTAPGGSPSGPRDLYSSSSSSEPPDGSFLLPGAVPDTLDPFSRFWGRLENMLEEISFPKALHTAMQEAPPATPAPAPSQAIKTKSKVKAPRSPSPSESFYVVPRGRDQQHDPAEEGNRAKVTPASKTNEELQLENEGLRASLDALAKRTHQLELSNRTLTTRAAERDKMVQSVVKDVRREAQRARHDHEVMKSQMLVSTAGLTPGQVSASTPTVLKKRVAELEEEVNRLKDDNEKLSSQLDKFKEKWDKLKAKKEAKVAAARQTRSPRPPDPAP